MDPIQNKTRLLELAYTTSYLILRRLSRILKPGGKIEKIFIFGEKITKKPIFNCQMCGTCVLHSTGMTCPMNCPKNLRNGPCGGVRQNGNCEVIPDMACIWVKAWERSSKMSVYGERIESIIPPLDWRRSGKSAWITELNDEVLTIPGEWE